MGFSFRLLVQAILGEIKESKFMTSIVKNRKIVEIDRLRGIAILSVIFYHLSLSRTLFEKLGFAGDRMPLLT